MSVVKVIDFDFDCRAKVARDGGIKGQLGSLYDNHLGI